MKNLYDINKWLLIITVLLYFSFWGGIMAQVLLGAVQIVMSIYILAHFQKLLKITKILFIAYVFTTLSIIGLFKIITANGNGGLELMFLWIFITMLLALFHLYITYKIKTQ